MSLVLHETQDEVSLSRSNTDSSCDFCGLSGCASTQSTGSIRADENIDCSEDDNIASDTDYEWESHADDSYSECSLCVCLERTSLDENGESPSERHQHELFHSECPDCQDNTSSMSLCRFCQHLRLRHLLFCLVDDEEWSGLYCEVAFGTLADLHVRQTAGCGLCDLLSSECNKAVLASNTEAPLDQLTVQMSFRKASATLEDPVQITLELLTEEHGIVSSIPAINAYEMRRFDELGIAQLKKNTTTPLPLIDWARIRRWYNSCCTVHKRCHAPQAYAPKHDFRLIDVRQWCLVQVCQPVEFLALSYVWGSAGKSILQTLMSNAGQLEVPGSLLPAMLDTSIYDAIVACSKLGFQYLWVDRLCIVQDDLTEKERHIAAMDEIYSHAAIVLVHCTGLSMADRLPGVEQTRTDKKLCLYVDKMHLSTSQTALRPIVMESVWASRGWTYQEGVFARARLYFTENQAIYECETGRISEDNQENSEPWLGDDIVDTCVVTRSLLSWERGGRSTNYDLWRWHVPAYNSRQLSYASDVHAGFAGIANAIYGSPNALYYGHPIDEFHRSLLWSVDHAEDAPSAFLRASSDAVTPSWSWTSVNAKIIVSSSTLAYICPLLEWHMAVPSHAGSRWASLASKQARFNNGRVTSICEDPGTDVLQLRWTNFAIKTIRHSLLAVYSALPAAWREAWFSSDSVSIGELKAVLRSFQSRLCAPSASIAKQIQLGSLAASAQVVDLTISDHAAHNMLRTGWTCTNAPQMLEVLDDSGQIIGWVGCPLRPDGPMSAKQDARFEFIALSIGMLESDGRRLDDKIECIIALHGHKDTLHVTPDSVARLRDNRHLALTYWLDSVPMQSIPVVNVMMLEQSDGYYTRLSTGWVLLTAWAKLTKQVRDIILI